MKKLLLHICCAPDATYGIEYFSKDFDVTVFFYNPNIHPREEYRLRLIELYRVARRFGVDVIEGKYDPERWFEAVRGMEDEPEGGRRCSVCFKMRLEETARVAKELGFDAISTVLTISPKKDAELINRIGRAAAARHGIEWIDSNLKKGGGFKRSLELSREFELYRQEYCGCIFSLWEAEHIRRLKTMERIEQAEREGDMIAESARFPGTPSETLFRKEIRNELEEMEFPNIREVEFRFMGWKPLKAKLSVARTGPSFKAYPLFYSPSSSGRVRGYLVPMGEIEKEGMRFKRFSFTKGGLEFWVRLDGQAVPFLSPYFPTMVPALSVEQGILDYTDQKMDVEMLVEFNDRARSGILLAWKGNPGTVIAAPIDSAYTSPGWSRKIAALKLLQLSRELQRDDILFAFIGCEVLGNQGFRRLMEALSAMFPGVNRVIKLVEIGRGEALSVRHTPNFDIAEAFRGASFDVESPVIQPSNGLEIAEIRAVPDPFYNHPLDDEAHLDQRLADRVMEVIRAFLEDMT